MNFQTGSDSPNSDLSKFQIPIFFSTVWMNFLTEPDAPNWDLSKFQIPISPRLFGWISRPGLIPQLRFEQVPNLNFSQSQFFPTVWKNFQTRSDFPNWDFNKFQIPIFPRPFGKIPDRVTFPQLRFAKPQIFLDRLEKFQTGSDLSFPRDSLEPRIN